MRIITEVSDLPLLLLSQRLLTCCLCLPVFLVCLTDPLNVTKTGATHRHRQVSLLLAVPPKDMSHG